jgi:hypothetical protein|tara:strand:- start:401 stop:517 length:117 start_codon:yes stop_codon:yes gene_type:complete
MSSLLYPLGALAITGMGYYTGMKTIDEVKFFELSTDDI